MCEVLDEGEEAIFKVNSFEFWNPVWIFQLIAILLRKQIWVQANHM